MAWDSALWEAVAARLTVEQGRLTIDEASARMLGGWLRLTPETFVDLQGPRHDFHVHLAAEHLDLQLETGKRMQLLALVLPLFLRNQIVKTRSVCRACSMQSCKPPAPILGNRAGVSRSMAVASFASRRGR